MRLLRPPTSWVWLLTIFPVAALLMLVGVSARLLAQRQGIVPASMPAP